MFSHNGAESSYDGPTTSHPRECCQNRLTSTVSAGSLQASKQQWCVDLHPKPGLFPYPASEFASSAGVSARPPEPLLALRTLGAFFYGGISHV